jgi:hypothetical protein
MKWEWHVGHMGEKKNKTKSWKENLKERSLGKEARIILKLILKSYILQSFCPTLIQGMQFNVM